MNAELDLFHRMNRPYDVPVERLWQGEPILAPTSNWWESGVTFNPSAIYLEPAPENENIIRALLPMRDPQDFDMRDGIVAVHYRARPEKDPDSYFGRSFLGLALFTPQLSLLYRYQEPVFFPSPDPVGVDSLGVEDPRITRFGKQFYMVYCGVRADPVRSWKANLCLAVSDDLLHWQKLGVMPGDITRWNNKDGVLFPELIEGKYYLLHRPFAEEWALEDYSMHLAESESLGGPWKDLGEVLRAYPNPRMRASWVGAGSVPVPVGEDKYIHVYHTGNYLNETDREYDLDCALLDFKVFDSSRPDTLVSSRIEPLMVPETPAELRSRSQLQVGNVLFSCGSYVYQDWLYIIYGGADTYTLAARVRVTDLISSFEHAGHKNPFHRPG